MSGIIGKKNSTLKKESVKESKLLETGVRNLKFWHEASEGDKSIPFGSLVTPESILAGGLSNPTSTAILAANLGFFKENVEVRSSLNGDLMIGLTYVVSNSQIKFVNGYEAVEGEVFEVKAENNVVIGNTIVDARPLTATGILAIGNTDFNVGESFKTNANPNTQLGDVLVFMDGILQFRNVANATAAPLADGNYQEIHAANGSGVIIRFNDSFAVDRNIIVTSRNLIAERPNLSMLQAIEGFGGQLDKVIETTASLAGVPETDFQAAPNQVDLKAFGDKVVLNEQNIKTKQDKFEILTQTNILTTSVSTTTADIVELKFSNLEIGKFYRLSGQAHHLVDDTNSHSSDFQVLHDGNVVAASLLVMPGGGGTLVSKSGLGSKVFKATASTLVATWTEIGTTVLIGDGTLDGTWLQLEELPNHKETSKWS